MLNGSCEIWCSVSGACLQQFRGHKKSISDCCWSQDDRFIVTASDDTFLMLWQSAGPTAPTCMRVYKGHTSPVLCCCMNWSNTLLASGSIDEAVRLWCVASGECIAVVPAHADPVTCVSFSKDDALLVSVSYDGSCRVWDVNTCCCVHSVSHSRFAPITRLALSARSCSIFAGTSAGELLFSDLNSDLVTNILPRKFRRLLLVSPFELAQAILVVAVDTEECVVLMLLEAHGQVSEKFALSHTSLCHDGELHAADCTQNGRQLIICGKNTIHVYEARVLRK